MIKTLKLFHVIFLFNLKRLNLKKSQISKLYKNDLFIKSRY